MKKIVTSIGLIISFISIHHANAQQNILPVNGNVGIGTTAPSANLEVMGDVRIHTQLNVDGGITVGNIPLIENPIGPGNQLLFINEAGVIRRGTFGDVGPWLGGGGSPQTNCTLDPDGNVLNPNWNSGTNKIYTQCPEVNIGINMTNPRVKLDVKGTSYSEKIALGQANPILMGDLNFFMKTATGNATAKIFSIENASEEIFSLQRSGSLTAKSIESSGVFKLNTTLNDNELGTVFTIENNNRKLMQLNNNGILQLREIKVDLLSWPDYVFKTEYRLPTIYEVEQFINKNGHLPNVPSAKTIEMQGLNLGEMNKIQMEKIEELTLYLIQQQKIIDELSKKVSVLENQK